MVYRKITENELRTMHRFQIKLGSKLFLALLIGGILVSSTVAGTFRRTKTMELKYGWGTSSIAEFDQWEQDYPGSVPIADLTFFNNGTFDAFDRASGATGGGIYDKSRRNIRITIVPDGPYGTVEYVGKRVQSRTYEGEIQVNGMVWGHWRGVIQ